jgi:hypothetical protein
VAFQHFAEAAADSYKPLVAFCFGEVILADQVLRMCGEQVHQLRRRKPMDAYSRLKEVARQAPRSVRICCSSSAENSTCLA